MGIRDSSGRGLSAKLLNLFASFLNLLTQSELLRRVGCHGLLLLEELQLLAQMRSAEPPAAGSAGTFGGWAEWQDDYSLPIQVARAQIEALRTASDPEGRYRAKWQLVRNLYEMGYNAEDVRELFRLIDWMMQLREDFTERFKQELDQLEESLQMPYVTSVERLAKAEGIAEGIAKGIAKGSVTVLLKQLTKLCGPLPERVEQHVHGLPIEQLAALGEALLDFRSLADLQSWLDVNANGEG